MNKRVAYLSLCAGLVVVVALLLVWTPGIKAQNLSPAQEQPQQGAKCTVFLLDHAPSQVIALAIKNGAQSTVTGEFFAMDAEWIILKSGDNGKQVWINRDSVAAMAVNSSS